ncbi:MAG: methyltransferase domain-containing protein [Alphaproteobacteria bacterium]|uniref:Methyltransferase domain-containing protein n=1 Tax=Candidatus Nitrobium versatile TaxID=2884831 RepID=A0A953J4M3_9BACT|nr:methyltransferase domain-containing protein [Candidatus Nitrobium versatile]
MPGIKEAKELRKLWGGFWSSRVLLTANNYRIFDFLAVPRTVEEMAKRMKTDLRATEILLDAVTGLGLLKKSAGKYRNTSLASAFLVSGSPLYQGDILRHADALWQSWSGLDETVRTGKPNRTAPHNHDAFIRGMHNLASLKAGEVMRAIGLKGVRKALDLGGGPGTYSMEMAKKSIAVTLFDLPDTIRIAKTIIRKAGVKGIEFLKGDFMVDRLGSGYDLIFVSQVLHAFSAEENLQLLRKCRGALNPGGRIVIQEFYLASNRTSPSQSALFSVNMLVNTEGGRCYAPSEMKKWLVGAGFREARETLQEETVLVEARTAGPSPRPSSRK